MQRNFSKSQYFHSSRGSGGIKVGNFYFFYLDNFPHCPDRTPEHRPSEVLDLIHDTFRVSHSIQSEGEYAGGLDVVSVVPDAAEGVGPADLSRDLRESRMRVCQ